MPVFPNLVEPVKEVPAEATTPVVVQAEPVKETPVVETPPVEVAGGVTQIGSKPISDFLAQFKLNK